MLASNKSVTSTQGWVDASTLQALCQGCPCGSPRTGAGTRTGPDLELIPPVRKKKMTGMRSEDKTQAGECGVCVCVFESLATLHSTKGGLYHSPPLQTKHTSPNKDNTVRMLPPCTQTAHGSVSEGTVPQKTSCHLHSYMHGPHFLSYLLLRKSKH